MQRPQHERAHLGDVRGRVAQEVVPGGPGQPGHQPGSIGPWQRHLRARQREPHLTGNGLGQSPVHQPGHGLGERRHPLGPLAFLEGDRGIAPGTLKKERHPALGLAQLAQPAGVIRVDIGTLPAHHRGVRGEDDHLGDGPHRPPKDRAREGAIRRLARRPRVDEARLACLPHFQRHICQGVRGLAERVAGGGDSRVHGGIPVATGPHQLGHHPRVVPSKRGVGMGGEHQDTAQLQVRDALADLPHQGLGHGHQLQGDEAHAGLACLHDQGTGMNRWVRLSRLRAGRGITRHHRGERRMKGHFRRPRPQGSLPLKPVQQDWGALVPTPAPVPRGQSVGRAHGQENKGKQGFQELASRRHGLASLTPPTFRWARGSRESTPGFLCPPAHKGRRRPWLEYLATRRAFLVPLGAQKGVRRIPCAASSESSVIPRPPTWPTWACMRCNTAGRNRRALSRRMGTRCASTGRWGWWRTSSPRPPWRSCWAARPSATCATPPRAAASSRMPSPCAWSMRAGRCPWRTTATW
ncbi:conserved hypothetical protein [Stigmatella aurantiaca DW4/3-1]|uniref:Uncharacterized protein n=1 Tax=Stigmatella aurantiaca (strain DW4/3-1) TaxID=378806 RepID=Q092V8_STIAD|nr:conserved hypothetical protein [Stigmatella aurantiaca DW4/3-1]